jgi:hypothetical protein
MNSTVQSTATYLGCTQNHLPQRSVNLTQFSAPVNKNLWGQLDPEVEVESSDEEEEEEEDATMEDAESVSGFETPMSSISSLPSGIETPQIVELRKETKRSEERELYTVIPQTQTQIKGFMGSQHGYALPANGLAKEKEEVKVEDKKEKEKKKYKDSFKF